ncbi:MAG TPA: HD domain-containing protein [Candidatus Monoglobus merdigallinarum]|uniref:HD domain-containing protein n=1 Tax=Candidatus Monoglobus merdigallinarum TaxID=2838698 RepID=A0A9D1TLD2_9FIRM|nr:HD domain-containing protein [Candidatus Monoglobus merdigallinarum]
MTDTEKQLHEVKKRMIEFYKGDPKRVYHFLAVYSIAEVIGKEEGLTKDVLCILLTAALVHDIGIKASEEKYGSSAGVYQEKEGPFYARQLLEETGYDRADIDRICFLVGHHHSYSMVDGLDFRILVEADFIVNAYEDRLSSDAIRKLSENVFKTEAGIRLLHTLFLT